VRTLQQIKHQLLSEYKESCGFPGSTQGDLNNFFMRKLVELTFEVEQNKAILIRNLKPQIKEENENVK